MKKWMALAAALALGVSAGAANAADKLKACWVYVGPVGDFGYSYQHDLGRKAVEKALGDKVETAFLENVAEGPDARRVQRPHSHLEDKPMVGEQIRARVEEEMCGRGGVGGVGSSGVGGARRSSKEWSRRAREV